MTTINLWPKPGVVVEAENGSVIPADGVTVTASKYYLDLIRGGLLFTYDPREDPSGTPTPIPSGGSGVPTYAGATLLSETVGSTAGAIAITNGFAAAGDGGGGTWYWDPDDVESASDNATCCGDGNGRWKRSFSGTVNAQWFGAKGDNSQTLVSYPSTVAVGSGSFPITQQTSDAIAINAALAYLKENGGGTLYLPKGTYRIYAYLMTIDFPCRIVGDGIGVTILKNCDTSPTNAHGYGLLHICPIATDCDVVIENLTLDGHGSTRTEPTAEFQSYNVAVYGSARFKVNQIESKDAVIDCMLIHTARNDVSFAQIDNSRLSNSWRNTLTVATGWNIQFTNCLIEGGGVVHGGHNPRYTIDIEPDDQQPVRNLAFANCTIRKAVNSLLGCVWSGPIKFTGCTFDASEGSTVDGYPWLGNVTGSQTSFTGCSFRKTDDFQGVFKFYNPMDTGVFITRQYTELKSCDFEGVGIAGNGRDMRISDCTLLNSGYPVIFEGDGDQNLVIKGLTLINVMDTVNVGAGAVSSFTITSTFEGYADIDGLAIRFEPSMLPTATVDKERMKIPAPIGTGIFVSSVSPATIKLCNVHVAGYYQKYPTTFGYTPSALNFADWNTPGPAPADSSGQTCGPAGRFYKNCTEYGNSP